MSSLDRGVVCCCKFEDDARSIREVAPVSWRYVYVLWSTVILVHEGRVVLHFAQETKCCSFFIPVGLVEFSVV